MLEGLFWSPPCPLICINPESTTDYLPAWIGHLCPCSTSASALHPAARPQTAVPLRLWLSALCTDVDGSLQRGQQTPWGCHYPASRQILKDRETEVRWRSSWRDWRSTRGWPWMHTQSTCQANHRDYSIGCSPSFQTSHITSLTNQSALCAFTNNVM